MISIGILVGRLTTLQVEVRYKLNFVKYNCWTNEAGNVKNPNINEEIFQLMTGELFSQWLLNYRLIEFGCMFIRKYFCQSLETFLLLTIEFNRPVKTTNE